MSGRYVLSSLATWETRVLLGHNTKVGLFTSAITLAITNVLPVPVAPLSKVYLCPPRTEATTLSMHSGWSPEGEKGAETEKSPFAELAKQANPRALGGCECGHNPMMHPVPDQRLAKSAAGLGVVTGLVLAPKELSLLIPPHRAHACPMA